MNPYLEILKDELREECGNAICQADWGCFWDGLKLVDSNVLMWASMWPCNVDDAAQDCASYAQGTRADLPSIVKYAYAAIEENLK